MGILDPIIEPVGDIVGGLTGSTAAAASKEASQTQAAYQKEALDYLKEKEAIPQQFREGALSRLAGMYGIEGGTGGRMSDIGRLDQEQLVSQAMTSPLYQALMGTKESAEEAVLRNAAATGGLRSGNVQQALADTSSNIERQALLDSYGQSAAMKQYNLGFDQAALNRQLGGLQSLANLQTYAPQIAGMTSGIGQTLAQGQVGAAQAGQKGVGNLLKLGLIGAGAGAGAVAGVGAFSDIRLKDNIKPMGQKYGHNWYSWDWNEEAKALGLTGSDEGVMAHEVNETNPELISHDKGYLKVNMEAIKNG